MKTKRNKKNIYTVVDIGTTKICTIIAEKKQNDKGETYFHVEGVGISKSQGMIKGSVCEMNLASESISKSIKEAENKAKIKAVNFYIGIADEDIKSSNFEANIKLNNASGTAKREINQDDIQQVINEAKRVAKYQPQFAELKIIHAIPLYFKTDDNNTVTNPLNMNGSKLSSRVHIVFANENKINNIIRCFKICDYNVSVDNIILEPIASSYAVLNKDQKDLGAILIDMGGGTTDIAVFYHNTIRFSAVVSYGGYELTRKLSEHLMASPDTAEQLKISYGQAIKDNINDNEFIEVTDITGKGPKEYNKKVFAMHIQEEMTNLVHQIFLYLSRKIKLEHLSAGIYLTGGGSKLKFIDDLIEQLTQMPCIVRNPDLSMFRGQITNLAEPEYSTAVGIFLYVLDNETKKGFNSSLIHQNDGIGKAIWKFIKSLFV